MAGEDPKTKTLGEQIVDTTNAARDYIAGAVGTNPGGTTTDNSAPSTEPTVAGKLGEAWQSAKEAAGLAGEKAQENAEVTKAQAGNTADHAAVKADEANAELAQKKEEAKVQASVAGDNVHKAAQDARDTTAAKAQTAVDNATALVNPTPPLSGTAVYTFNLYSNASDPQDPYVSPSAELRCCVFALFFWS